MIVRTILYNQEHPDGKLFTDKHELSDAIVSGWVEAPWLVENELGKIEGRIAVLDSEIAKLEKKTVNSAKRKAQATKLISIRKQGRPRKGG